MCVKGIKCHCALCIGGRCPGSRNRAGSAAEKGLSERMNAHVEACGLGSFLRRGGVLLEAMKTRLKLALRSGVGMLARVRGCVAFVVRTSDGG